MATSRIFDRANTVLHIAGIERLEDILYGGKIYKLPSKIFFRQIEFGSGFREAPGDTRNTNAERG
jgi:hypothetical protein